MQVKWSRLGSGTGKEVIKVRVQEQGWAYTRKENVRKVRWLGLGIRVGIRH